MSAVDCSHFSVILGETRYFPEMEVARDDPSYFISLRSYIVKTIVKFGMGNAKPIATSIIVRYLQDTEPTEPAAGGATLLKLGCIRCYNSAEHLCNFNDGKQ